jgi:poly(A) polymerase
MGALERIAEATEGTDWENRLYLVGGAVRDELLNLARTDFDVVLETDAAELAEFLHGAGLSSIPPVTYPRFGTAMVRVDGANVELVTARRESYVEDSRKPTVAPATLREDALRRDFTVNTLLRNLHTGELLDPLGSGLNDLQAGVLRTPLDAAETFSDDPLRMIRAIRFKVRFGLTPAQGLMEAIVANRDRLKIVSFERIRDEFVKILEGPDAHLALGDLMETGLLDLFIPEFRQSIGVSQGSYHSKDVWGHTLDVLEQSEGRSLTVRLASLLHDIGKPLTRSVEGAGRVRFFGHEDVGAELATAILKRLKFRNETVEAVAALVKNHMRLGSAVPFTPAAARRLRRDLGDLVEPLLEVCEADATALARISKGIDFADVREKLRLTESSVVNKRFDSPLSGSEIMEMFGLGPGPEVGRLKKLLSDAVVEGAIQADDKEAAKSHLQKSR